MSQSIINKHCPNIRHSLTIYSHLMNSWYLQHYKLYAYPNNVWNQ